MADFVRENAEFRVESNKAITELKDEIMNGKDLNYNSYAVGVVDHKNSACFSNVNDNSSVLEKMKLDASESEKNEKNDVFTEEESAIVDNSGTEYKIETVLNGAVENGELYSGNSAVLSDNGNLDFGDEVEIGILDVKDAGGVVEEVIEPKDDDHDACSVVEKSVILTNEHQAIETEKEEADYSNGISLESKEDGTLAAVAEGAELEEHSDPKVELGPEQEEKAKSELACENGKFEAIADVGKVEESGIGTYEHQTAETENEKADYSNERSLEIEEDGTLDAVAEGAALEDNTNSKVGFGPEIEEKAKSEPACENGGAEAIADVGKVEDSGIGTYEHQAAETEKGETDYSNERSLESEEDGTLDDVAEGAELEDSTNSKVEFGPEIEEVAKSESACENGGVEAIADVGKVEESGIGIFEHQAAETKNEADYGNERSPRSEEDGTLAAVAEGAEVEGHTDPKVELGPEQEEKAKAKLACENGQVEGIADVGKVEESGMETCEHRAAETEKEADYGNERSLQSEEDGTLAAVAEGAEVEGHTDPEKEEAAYHNGRSLESEEDGTLTAEAEFEEQANPKVESGPEQEEKAKSELACENGEIEAIADIGKVDDVCTYSNSVINDDSASGDAELSNPKPVNEGPVKTRSWRDIAIDGMDSIPDKVQFTSRTPMVRRSVPKFVKSIVRSVELKSKIESEVCQTKSINVARSSEVRTPSLAYEESQIEESQAESVLDKKFKSRDSTSEEKLEQVAKQRDCKLEYGADLFAKSKEMKVGQKYMNTSTIVGIDREEQVKENKWTREKEEKARREEKLRKRKEAEEEKLREEDAKKERLRKEKEAAGLRKRLVAEEMEKMRKAEELNKKKKAEKQQKRAEYKAQKEAEEKEKKKAKKNKKQAGTSDTSSVSSDVSASSPEKNSPEASHSPETSRSAVSKKSAVFSSSKKKSNIPKDPLPLPPTLRNRSKRRLMKWMWPLLVTLVVLALFFAGDYTSSESMFLSFTF